MMKLKLNLTIKRMLTGLIAVCVLVTGGLAIISYYSNGRLMKSQVWLSEIVIPLDTVTQKVKMAAASFTMHTYLMREARSLEELEQIVEIKQLKQPFTEGIRHLRELSEKAQVADAAQELPNYIKGLETLYADTLDKNAAILQSVQNSLRLERDIKRQVATMNELGSELHENAGIFSEKVNAIQEQVAVKGQTQASSETPEDGGQGAEGGEQDNSQPHNDLRQITRVQKISSDLRLDIAFMTNYGRQMLMAGEEEKISSIKTDKIVQTAKRIESSLGTLASFSYEEDMGSAELKTILQKMETDFVLLRSVLTDGKQSLAVLRSQWLGEQKSLSLRNNALKETADSLTASLKNIQLSADRVRHQTEEEAVQTSQAAEWVISVVCLSAIAFMILVGTLIIRRIVIPINKAVAFAIIISNGDLTAEIQKDHDDEVGNLVSKLSDMAHNLNALIGQVQRSGIQVTSSATELSATSRQQEAVMRTQLESTNYVVKSVGEISSISEDLVETMKKVASMSDQTADFASSGQSDLSHMEEAMHHMENASKSISGKLEAINEKAANITSVVTTITKVADQTNLLSLNAAIEAEKAGEYGRGFTVVAREIRRLADQTAVATLDIDQMVQEMQSAVSAGVMEMDAFITEVQRSAENVGKISMQLSRIIEQVKALSPSFEGVNESMQFQAQNAQQINSSMLNLSEEMQQTVDSLRESFMAIEQLNDAASGLQDEVSRFRVM